MRALFEVAVELSRKWQPVHYRGACTSLVHYHSTIVVLVHRWCTITALSRCLYIIGALSQHFRGHNGTTLHCHALTMLQYHQHNLHSHRVCRSTSLKSSSLAQYRGHNSTLLHYHAITMLQYCTIMLLRYCHNILSQSYDLDIISNRAFIATLETIVAVTKYVLILFSQ